MDKKIIALATCQRVLSWVSVCPAAANTSAWKKVLFKIFPIVLIATDLTGLLSSIVYVWESMTTSLEKSLYTLFQISGLVIMTNATIVTFLLRDTWPKVFNSLKKIYDANADRELIQYLIEANDRSEWIWRAYLKLTCVALAIVLVIMPGVSVTFQLVICGNFDGDSVFHPFFFRLPWNQNTLLGYFGELCYGTNAAYCSTFLSGVQLIVFISICLHHWAFHKIFRQISCKLNNRNQNQNNQQLLCELIRFHISVKKWFVATADIYSPYIMVHLICNIIYLASNIFQLDLQLRHPGFSLTMILVLTTFSTSNLLLYCLFGKLATESFVKMADCLFESNWQELSIDLQKYLIMMVVNAQTPFYYHGFEIAVLNLETFTKMLKVTFSYYMMFKTLTNK